jgi:hypothetical protein
LWLAPAALAQPSFAAPTDYPVGDNTQSVAVGDLNGDGKPDLAIANNLSGDVSVLLGDGIGGFGAATSHSVGVGATSVAMADLNGDGKLDLAVANLYSGAVILLGNGAGGFGAATSYAAGSGSFSVAVGDLNGDARPDLAIANEFSDNVSVLLGSGDGTFTPAVNFSTGDQARSVAVADLNGDSKPDLAVSNLGANTVSVLLGNGDGTFAPAVSYLTGTGPISVAVGDLNGDGKPDLVTANDFVGNVSVLLGVGAGVFGAATAVTTTFSPIDVKLADVDGDGTLDLVLANFLSSSDVSLLLGDGSGGFGGATDYPAGAQAVSVAVADLNGDAKPDLVLARQGGASTGHVSVLLNTTTPSCDPSLSPAGCWRFGEPAGTALLDSSGHANNGTYLGGVALGAIGIPGAAPNTAATYDGVNDTGRVPDSSSLGVGNSFTLEGWIKRSSTTKTHELFNKGGNGFQLVVMNAASLNRVLLRKANVTTIAQSTVPVLADNRYHHIVATMNGPGTAKIYIDGALASTSLTATQQVQDTTWPLTFGVAGSTPAKYDEFALYDQVLTPEQIAAHYAAGMPT